MDDLGRFQHIEQGLDYFEIHLSLRARSLTLETLAPSGYYFYSRGCNLIISQMVWGLYPSSNWLKKPIIFCSGEAASFFNSKYADIERERNITF